MLFTHCKTDMMYFSDKSYTIMFTDAKDCMAMCNLTLSNVFDCHMGVAQHRSYVLTNTTNMLLYTYMV